MTDTFRIATYNIHKCVGVDRKYDPDRIVAVLKEIDADVIGLQEVLCHSHLHKRDHQAEYIADLLGYKFVLGKNRQINGSDYGNVVLSRSPILSSQNHDISVSSYEPRGCLRADVELPNGRVLYFFNVHMGTSFFERRKQVHKLLAGHVLGGGEAGEKRIIVGDFNEWSTALRHACSGRDLKVWNPNLTLALSDRFRVICRSCISITFIMTQPLY